MKKIFFIFAVLLILVIGMNVKAGQRTIKIAAFGDSTTAGTPFFRSPVEAPPDGEGDARVPYTYRLAQGHENWMVFNRGVAGERTDEVFERMKKDIPRLKPDVVIVLAGVNDLFQGHTPLRVKNRLEEMYQFAGQNKITVVACTVLPYKQASDKVIENMSDVNKWIKKYSSENGLFFCDTAKAVEGSASPDGLHPDRAGYQKMAEALAPIVEKACKSLK